MTDFGVPIAGSAQALGIDLSKVGYVPPHSPAALTNGHITEDGDGEDYTIKCICSFTDDDGSTVMCEKCDTWQHVACYYQDRSPPGEDDSHYCIDCEPRKLDARYADDIQRRLRGSTPEETQRKPKKPGPKPKKKAKNDHLSQTNGHTNGHGSPRNGAEPPAKRPKARHQSSSSTTNIPLKLPGQASRRSASTSHVHPSPLKSPDSPMLRCDPNEAFSPEFMHLYDHDSGNSNATVNEFDDIDLTMTLGDWVRDEDILSQATQGKRKADVFQRSNKPMPDRVPLQIHTKVDKNLTAHGKHPKWKFITVEQDIGHGAFVGELHGKIGSMQAYTEEPANRWDFLRHPVPFVFFHPQLPIIVDTREEGSVFRYLRRSCNPNLNMRTVLEEEFDYHFVFFANREIEQGEELTIGWTLDEHVRRFFRHPEDRGENDNTYLADYCRNLLAEFGGCACDEGNCKMCQWAGWYGDNPPPNSGKGRRKGVRGASSRSGSEALKQYDEEAEDGTAASTSSHSKSHSRDNTPSSTIDSKHILGEPISEREKRKIAALERSEQERQPDKKKIKRKSADTRQGSHNPPPTPRLDKKPFSHDDVCKDSASPTHDIGSKTGSRITPSPFPGTAAASPPPKVVYRESSCQTDIGAASPPMPSPTRILPRRSKNPLHRHVFRTSILKTEKTVSPKTSPVPEVSAAPEHSMIANTPVSEAPPVTAKKEDVDMEDVSSEMPSPETPVALHKDADATVAAPEAKPDAGPTPATESMDIDQPAESTNTTVELAKVEDKEDREDKEDKPEKPDLRIVDMPPPPLTLKTLTSVETPTVVESPAPLPDASFKLLGAPSREEKSPESKKKKLTLKDWTSRRSSSTAQKPDDDSNSVNDAVVDAVSGLMPLKEEAPDKNTEEMALDTPAIEKGDPTAT